MSSVTLRDGRRLAYSSFGCGAGPPVFYLHGAIGSPLALSPEFAETIERLGLRWICVQRPGFGGSTPAPGRTMLGFAADLEQLAARLGVSRAAVLGVSAGGPYALACAHALPGLVGAVALCSSISPLCPPWAAAAWPLRVPLRALATVPGAGGMREDYAIGCRPWGFDTGDVGVEVHLWHGTLDPVVRVGHARLLASSLPRCRARFVHGEGHFFLRRRVAEIVGSLVSAAALRVPADERTRQDVSPPRQEALRRAA